MKRPRCRRLTTYRGSQQLRPYCGGSTTDSTTQKNPQQHAQTLNNSPCRSTTNSTTPTNPQQHAQQLTIFCKSTALLRRLNNRLNNAKKPLNNTLNSSPSTSKAGSVELNSRLNNKAQQHAQQHAQQLTMSCKSRALLFRSIATSG